MAFLIYLFVRILGLHDAADVQALHFAKCRYQETPEPGLVKWSCH